MANGWRFGASPRVQMMRNGRCKELTASRAADCGVMAGPLATDETASS